MPVLVPAPAPELPPTLNLDPTPVPQLIAEATKVPAKPATTSTVDFKRTVLPPLGIISRKR
jgi:hypothetical protein